jgi:hypothetical protein
MRCARVFAYPLRPPFTSDLFVVEEVEHVYILDATSLIVNGYSRQLRQDAMGTGCAALITGDSHRG